MTRQPTTRAVSKPLAVVNMLEKRQQDIEDMLAPGVSPATFVRTVKNALLRDPKIAEADQQSIFLECQKAAQDGLVLDGREAVLTRFTTKKRYKEGGSWKEQWVTEVVYIPMVFGIMKRVHNTGEVRSWVTGVVYENEMIPDKNGNVRFRYIAGDHPRIEHEPIIVGERGPVVAVYSSVKLRDNTYQHDVMTVDEVNDIMNRTKSRKRSPDGKPGEIVGPWVTDWVEMAKKTVIRRHSKRLPMSGENRNMIERIDTLYDFERGSGDEYADAGKRPSMAVQRKNKSSAAETLSKIADPAEETVAETPEDDDVIEGEVIDPETGEIEDTDEVDDNATSEDMF